MNDTNNIAFSSSAPNWSWYGGLLIVLTVILSNAGLSYQALTTLVASVDQVELSLERLEAIRASLSTLKGAESGQRGFIITGDKSYLQPYYGAVEAIDSNLATLTFLSVGQPYQTKQLETLKVLTAAKLNEFDTTIELRRNSGFEAASQIINTDSGERVMNQIRAIVDDLDKQESALLIEHRRQSQRSRDRAILTLSAATVVGLILLFIAFLLLRRVLQNRVEREQLLAGENARLEIQVAERTRELAALNATLQRSNRDLEEFAYVASHDLQEPLRKIRAFGDRLRQKYATELDSRGQDYIERMRQAAERMAALITALLTYSRVSSRGVVFQPVDLDELAGQVLSDLETPIQELGATVDVKPLPPLEADPMQLRQLLQNLLSNALKYHVPNVPPVITLSGQTRSEASREGHPQQDWVELRVQDNGIGFDEQYLDRIFTPFQRLHNRAEYEGTGMGLAVVRRICERHGGHVSAHSAPGQGTTFIVTLPIRQHLPTPQSEEELPA